jgi:DNA polymerase-1
LRSLTLEYLAGVAPADPSPLLRPLDGAKTPSSGHHHVEQGEIRRLEGDASESGRSGITVRTNYRYIADGATLAAILPELVTLPVAGLDTETTGLDPHRDKLRLIQIATPATTYVIDCFRVDPASLALWLGSDSSVKVLHNAKFDLRFLVARGLVVGKVFDTMLADQLLIAGSDRFMRSLAKLAEIYLGRALAKEEQTSDWSGDLTHNQISYAARDAAILPCLYDALEGRLREARLERAMRLENRAVLAVAWLEHVGCPFDATRWRVLADQALLDRIHAEKELNDLAIPYQSSQLIPGGINWNAPKQVLSLLAAAGIDLPNTDASTLAAHASIPIVAALLRYRDAEKRVSTYGLPFLGAVNAVSGRIHSNWHQIGAATGRMASGEPNLQNVPRLPAYRACFRAPEGRTLVKCDFSQVELRLAAEISGDETLLGAYRDGLDVHALTATRVLGAESVTKEQRQAAKALNFGLLYGAGAPTLRSYAASTYHVHFTEIDAQRLHDAFFATYPGLRAWHRRVSAELRKDASETRTLAGRRRLFPDPTKRRFTEFVNSPVQGSGADAVKGALALLWERRDRCPGAFPVLIVHDELVVECAVEQIEAATDWVYGAMSDALACFLKRVPVGDLEVQAAEDWSMQAGSNG